MTITYEPYSDAEDMLIGDLAVHDNAIKAPHLRQATDEIHAALGTLYIIPIDVDALEPYSLSYLRGISNKIASGRFMMAMGQSQDDQPNPYGRYLLREGQAELRELSTLKTILEGAARRDGTDESRAGGVIIKDAEAPFDYFERSFMTGAIIDGAPWMPGT